MTNYERKREQMISQLNHDTYPSVKVVLRFAGIVIGVFALVIAIWGR